MTNMRSRHVVFVNPKANADVWQKYGQCGSDKYLCQKTVWCDLQIMNKKSDGYALHSHALSQLSTTGMYHWADKRVPDLIRSRVPHAFVWPTDGGGDVCSQGFFIPASES